MDLFIKFMGILNSIFGGGRKLNAENFIIIIKNECNLIEQLLKQSEDQKLNLFELEEKLKESLKITIQIRKQTYKLEKDIKGRIVATIPPPIKGFKKY